LGLTSFSALFALEQVGRHLRLLAPPAFLSPRIIAAIVDGTAPAGLTVTGLAEALPYSWIEQEERIGLSLYSTGD
jgi:site-specific DNA recombinase